MSIVSQGGAPMVVVRPAGLADVGALEELAALTLPGVHTLPRTREKIAAAVERSIVSFAAHVDVASEESYLFVLETLAPATPTRVIGTAAIFASAGSNGTYFSFRNDVIQQVSRDLNISHSVHALTLCSELTGYSQLSGFCLRDLAHAGIEAALLSRARLLFAALAPQRFGERFFVPLAGITDLDGQSPFWDAVGRKFFQMDFLEAERIIGGARNRTLIVELMPHYPVYVPLLPGAAQAAMGQIHASGELPFNLLTAEGFEADDYIDIFDGGPILQAHKHGLRSFVDSMLRQVAAPGPAPAPCEAEAGLAAAVNYAIAAGSGPDFRAVIGCCAPLEAATEVDLLPPVQQALGVVPGDSVICVRM
jgi:arginine N-succinyltransferase